MERGRGEEKNYEKGIVGVEVCGVWNAGGWALWLGDHATLELAGANFVCRSSSHVWQALGLLVLSKILFGRWAKGAFPWWSLEKSLLEAAMDWDDSGGARAVQAENEGQMVLQRA